MSNLLNVTSAPHVRAKDDTQRIMLYVILSLVPAAVFGIFNFGISAAVMIALSIGSCVASEYIFERIVKKKSTIKDLSAVVTGLLLALNLPGGMKLSYWWMPVLGGAFAIVIVKMLYGGLGQNFMNPALGARCFLMLSFAGVMTDFSNYKGYADTFGGATPLATIKNGGLESVDLTRLFLGNIPGTIGETSALCLLIGAAFLIVMKVIDIRIPLTYILTFSVFALIFGGHGFDLTYLAAELCAGGIILGAFFMATDYVTCPITPVGKIVFGVCLGLLTGIFRIFGGSAEGVSYAIIFCNMLVPLIERFTIPNAFGIVKEKKEGKS